MKTLLGDLPDDYILNSVYEIENVLLILKSLDQKIDWYKHLKKYRTASIDEKINDLEERMSRLRDVVLSTMKKLEPKRSTMNFPAIASVTRKANPGKWEIEDEESLLVFLSKSGHKNDVIKVKETLDMKELKKVLDDFDVSSVKVPGVIHTPGKESISIKYEKSTSVDKEVPSETSNTLDEITNALDSISSDDV